MNKQIIEALKRLNDNVTAYGIGFASEALSQAIQWGEVLQSAERELRIGELEGDIVEGGMKYDDEVIKVATLKGELEYQKEQYRLVAKENKFLHTCYVVKNYEQLQQENANLRELLSEERIEQILSTPNFDIIFVNDKLKKDLARAIAKGKDEK